ncbi:MAG TPA: response regulator, partial [Candidatus Eisenbacteria bacterium]
FRVLSAGDGDEALRVALGERPDLVVLDVRLPKKSGLEVCERLRQDPEDPHVPIIMVSAAAETDSRLQGLARGADDYVAKPFSPKELIARIKRLLSRSTESREALKRGIQAERELARAREEAKRSQLELRSEQRLRQLTSHLGRDLHRLLDVDEMARRLLMVIHSRLAVGVAALLCLERPGGSLRGLAVCGDGFDRVADLDVAADGELAHLLCGLGRPVGRQELERFPELRGDLPAFVSAGFTLLAPLCGPDGLEGLLITDERIDGQDFSRHDVEALTALCDTAAVALHNAQRCRAQANGTLDALAALAPHDPREAGARAEAAALVTMVARDTLPVREQELVHRGAALGAWASGPIGRVTLRALASTDPSGRLEELVRLSERADTTSPGGSADRNGAAFEDPGPPAEESCAARLLMVARAFARARAGGLDAPEALACAEDAVGEPLDEITRRLLREALEERASLEDSAAQT